MGFISYFRMHNLEKKVFTLFWQIPALCTWKTINFEVASNFSFNFVTFSQKEFEIVSDMKRLLRKMDAKDKCAHLQLSLFVGS